MATQPKTTEHAAVWNPPRLRRMTPRGFGSGARGNPGVQIWEGGDLTVPQAPPNHHRTEGYRTPTSGEPVDPVYFNQS